LQNLALPRHRNVCLRPKPGAGPGAGKREGAFQNWKLVNADPLIKLSCSSRTRLSMDVAVRYSHSIRQTCTNGKQTSRESV